MEVYYKKVSFSDREFRCINFDLDTMKEVVGKNGKIIAYLLSDLGNLYVVQFSNPIRIKFANADHCLSMNSTGGLIGSIYLPDPVHLDTRCLSVDRVMFSIDAEDWYKKFNHMDDFEYKNHVLCMTKKVFDDISLYGIHPNCYQGYIKMEVTSDDHINEELKHMVKFWYSKNYQLIGKDVNQM